MTRLFLILKLIFLKGRVEFILEIALETISSNGARVGKGDIMSNEWKRWDQRVCAAILENRVEGALGKGVHLANQAAVTKRRKMREDEDWIMSDSEEIGSCEYVCAILDLNAGYVRRLFKKMKRKRSK